MLVLLSRAKNVRDIEDTNQVNIQTIQIMHWHGIHAWEANGLEEDCLTKNPKIQDNLLGLGMNCRAPCTYPLMTDSAGHDSD